MLNFPIAVEMNHFHFLQDLKEKIEHVARYRYAKFVDYGMPCNDEIKKYLEDRGFTVVEIRYENSCGEYGFWGRTDGDGDVAIRIIWGGDPKVVMNTFGDCRVNF